MSPPQRDERTADGGAERREVLVLSHYFWPEAFRINQVVEDLGAVGVNVTVLTGHPNYPEGKVFPGYDARCTRRERHPSGYQIFRVPVVPRGAGSSVRLLLNYLSFTASAALVGMWLLRGRRFDAIFVYCTTPVIQGYSALWLKLFKRCRVVLWVQDLWPQALSATGHVKSRGALRAVAASVSALYRRCDLILCQSRAFLPIIRPDAGQVPVRYFPNPGEGPSRPGSSVATLPEGKFNIVFAGNLGKAQALETVVEAAALLKQDPSIHISLFGSGSMTGWIAAQIEARGLSNLSLMGRVPPEAMAGIYAQASALLLTLVNDPLLTETVPSKLQSYLSSGVAVLAAVNGEAARIVEEAGAGASCPGQDAAALAATMQRLAGASRDELDRMAVAAKRHFEENFEPRMLALQLRDLLAGKDAAA